MGQTRPLRTLGRSPLLEAEASPVAGEEAMPEAIAGTPSAARGAPHGKSVPPSPQPNMNARAGIGISEGAEAREAAGNAAAEAPRVTVPHEAAHERAPSFASPRSVAPSGEEASAGSPAPLLPSIPREPTVVAPMPRPEGRLDLAERSDDGLPFSAPVEPPRLMPRVAPKAAEATFPVAPGRPSTISADQRSPGTVEETTEVHVNIGRIEVTAVQEAPAQKPGPRHRPQPMSLDEYLARRQGGRP